MKKILLFLLFFLPLFLGAGFYFLDKEYFLCPIAYRQDMVIRCDTRGNGFFAASRSGNRTHQGLDLLAEMGAQVKASRAGIVAAATHRRGMGNYIILRHPGNLITIYGHLLSIYVQPGQLVRQGQTIGAVGKTGNANYRDIQPHLHFEVRKNGTPQDPLEYLE